MLHPYAHLGFNKRVTKSLVSDSWLLEAYAEAADHLKAKLMLSLAIHTPVHLSLIMTFNFVNMH